MASLAAPSNTASQNFRRGARGQSLRHGAAELGRELGERVEPRMQFLFEPGTQALRENGRCARSADRDRHLAAIDDGGKREGAQLGPIGNVHRHAERARNRRDASVFLVVLGRGNDERASPQLIDAGSCRDQRRAARFDQRGKLGRDVIGGDIDEGARASKAAAS